MYFFIKKRPEKSLNFVKKIVRTFLTQYTINYNFELKKKLFIMRLHSRFLTHTHTHTHTRTHARTHTHARTRTRTHARARIHTIFKNHVFSFLTPRKTIVTCFYLLQEEAIIGSLPDHFRKEMEKWSSRFPGIFFKGFFHVH